MTAPCPDCELLADELAEIRHRLRIALTGADDGEIGRELPERVNNPGGVRNHEGMGECQR